MLASNPVYEVSIRPSPATTCPSSFSDVSPATAPISYGINSAKRYDVISAANSYALTLVDIFERAIAAIWRAHGEHMAELAHLRDQRWRAAAPGRDDDLATPHDIEP